MSEHLTPVKAIRKYCLQCSGDSPKEVRLCVIPECPLYPFRLGRNPNRKGRVLSEDEKQEIRDRFNKARKK